MAITSNLYPPIMPDILPAFNRQGECRIYFSLSSYNSREDIKNVQISMVNQRTNESILKKYPSGIKLGKVIPMPEKDLDPTSENYEELIKLLEKYTFYTTVTKADLTENDSESKDFELNQFYKIQLRFTSKDASTPTGEIANATWLQEQKAFFSEWSKVCLIKGIETPKIQIRGFSEVGTSEEVILSNSMISIIGEMYFNNPEETEYLKNYNIKIYQSDNLNSLVVESGEIYADPYHPNEFNYSLNYELFDGVNYSLFLTYVTNNLYSQTKQYDFKIIQYNSNPLNANIYATPDEENGRIKINIVSLDGSSDFIGNITIRRTSSKSNFHKWEDVHTIAYATHSGLNYTWYDNTIESGIWYKYCAQKRNSEGSRGSIVGQNNPPVMCIFEDIFLTREECQLKIKFNPSLNEFKYNVTESQQTSIGSKYPFIKRNGNNYYRTFPIGGLISSLIDTNGWYDPHWGLTDSHYHSDNENGSFHPELNSNNLFTSKEQLYGDSKQLYNNYNDINNINEYNDIIYEREFRNKVYDFLYKNNVKLFRSTTEGNILIKLMNIDFQPIESLGRRLYSFTATAVEIDEANITNYDKYKIQTIGKYQKDIYATYEIYGQLQGTFGNDNNNDIVKNDEGNVLEKIDLKQRNSANQGFINKLSHLKQLKLEIESEPYVIIKDENQLIKATSNSKIDPSTAILGYLVTINQTPMVIHSNAIRRESFINQQISQNPQMLYPTVFELQGDNVEITSLVFQYPTKVKISYIAQFQLREDTSNLFERIFYYNNVGQLYGTFTPETSIVKKIYNKYLFKNNKYYQQLLHINDIKLEGLPGTVVYMKDSEDTDFNRHILQNGFLQFNEDNINIEDLYFCGIHLYECKNPLEVNGLSHEDFVLQTQEIYNSFDELLQIENPENGGIYQVKGYGLLNGSGYLYNNPILVISNTDLVPNYSQVQFPELYSLCVNAIENDKNLQFVYYYNHWYLLKDAYEKGQLLKHDYRHIYEDEFVLVNQFQTSFDKIKYPITNGVYYVGSVDLLVVDESEDVSNLGIDNQVIFNNISDKLIVTENHVILKIDHNYSLIERLLGDSLNRYIYYHNNWYPFTLNNDVICPVNGIVDYSYELMKGEYLNVV